MNIENAKIMKRLDTQTANNIKTETQKNVNIMEKFTLIAGL